MTEEIWKSFDDAILVSNLGNLKSLEGESRKATRNSEGYYIFNVGKKLRNKKLHRVVALSFLPNPDNLSDVNHIDGDKSNNRLDNLEWCSRSDNIKHAYENNLNKHLTEEDSPVAKLTLEQAQYIYDNYETDGYNTNTVELAEKFNITPMTVRGIIKGERSNGKPQWGSVNRNRVFPETRNNGRPKQVSKIDKDTGEVLKTYSSMSEAKRAGEKGDIPACAAGRKKSAGGFLWKYMEI